jgi:hypothetical protein
MTKGIPFVHNGWRPGYRKGAAKVVAQAASLAQHF